MTIILDAMGSDKYPEPEISAAIESAKNGIEIILVGDLEKFSDKLKQLGGNDLPITTVHAPEVVEMWDKPVESGRQKPNNSMSIGINLLRENKGQAFVTAGNTGGAMYNAIRTLGRIEGVQRPPLSAMFPTRKGKCIVLDIGANVDCRSDFLMQFAILGSIYAEVVLKTENPRIGILSNGEEEGKGNQLVKDTFPLIKSLGFNFIGNIEPKELFNGDVDVVVTDGFVGNVLVKSSEAVAKLITAILKEELKSTFFSKLGAFLAKPAFTKIKSLVDPSEVGAAPLLGVNGLVFIGHGRSDSRAIVSAIKLAQRSIELNLLLKLREGIAERLS